MQFIRTFSFLFLLASIAACSNEPPASKPEIEFPETPATMPDELPATVLDQYPESEGSGQLLLVLSTHPAATTGTLIRYEKQDGSWRSLDTLPVNLGKSGMAAPGAKREGDGKAPAGLFDLGPAFGYEPLSGVEIPYIVIDERHHWISDPDSANYNQMVEYRPITRKMEVMRRQDHLYEFGVVIQYNSAPVVPGNGSAIFLHVQRAPDKPTLGCVSMEREAMRDLIRWLDPEKYPVVVLDSEF